MVNQTQICAKFFLAFCAKKLCLLSPGQVIAIRDIMRPANLDKFNDVYIVYELMDTDLHQIIRSSQQLSEDHCQVGASPS